MRVPVFLLFDYFASKGSSIGGILSFFDKRKCPLSQNFCIMNGVLPEHLTLFLRVILLNLRGIPKVKCIL